MKDRQSQVPTNRIKIFASLDGKERSKRNASRGGGRKEKWDFLKGRNGPFKTFQNACMKELKRLTQGERCLIATEDMRKGARRKLRRKVSETH